VTSAEHNRGEVAGWQINVYGNGKVDAPPTWIKDLKTILPLFKHPKVIIKHDHRSNVGIIEIDSVRYVVKKFTLQSTWFWFKLTSLIFPSIGEIACNNAIELGSAGILTPQPVMLMQRCEHGMVVESWLVYRYMEGRRLTEDDGGLVIPFVKQMHQLGWIHRDPHPGNFIAADSGTATIDPQRIRRTKNRYFKAYDVVLMSHDFPDTLDLYDRRELGVWFTVALAGHNAVRLYRGIKRGIRRALGIGSMNGINKDL